MTSASVGGPSPLAMRLGEVEDSISSWESAPDLVTARRFAEQTRNLVVGSRGPYYGDADGDGTIAGASAEGLLPGLNGESGVATDVDGPCVTRDVLGGSWSDPAARWAELADKIEAWTPTNNQFPTLPSHPQRIVGWATLAIDAVTAADALEYGGHAHLHVDVAQRAVTACSG